VLERLVVLAAYQGSAALVGSAAGLWLLNGEGLSLAILSWSAAGVFIGAVALYTTLLTRQGVFGALLATVTWGGMILGGDQMLRRWPWLWPLHVYLQPEDANYQTYLLNRASLILIGVGLVILALLRTQDTEHMLGVRRFRKVRA
jgi:hypothetical protein